MLLLYMPNEGDSMRRRKCLTLDIIISFGTSLPFLFWWHHHHPFMINLPSFWPPLGPFRLQTRLIFYWIDGQVIWGTIGATLPLCTLFHLYILYTLHHIYIHTKRLTLSLWYKGEPFPLSPNNNLLGPSFAQCAKDLPTIV